MADAIQDTRAADIVMAWMTCDIGLSPRVPLRCNKPGTHVMRMKSNQGPIVDMVLCEWHFIISRSVPGLVYYAYHGRPLLFWTGPLDRP